MKETKTGSESTSKLMRENKKQKREAYFKKTLAFFVAQEVPKLLPKLTPSGGVVLSIELQEAAEKDINKKYWTFIEDHIKPLLRKKDNPSAEILVDLYKILSTTEYAIMATKPIILKVNGNYIDYKNAKSFLIKENRINAEFAFYTAFNLLLKWDGYREHFGDKKINTQLQEFREPQKERSDSMSLKDEHIAIISASHNNASLPVFSNSTWWRWYCLCTTVIKKGKVDFTHFLPK